MIEYTVGGASPARAPKLDIETTSPPLVGALGRRALCRAGGHAAELHRANKTPSVRHFEYCLLAKLSCQVGFKVEVNHCFQPANCRGPGNSA